MLLITFFFQRYCSLNESKPTIAIVTLLTGEEEKFVAGYAQGMFVSMTIKQIKFK